MKTGRIDGSEVTKHFLDTELNAAWLLGLSTPFQRLLRSDWHCL